MSLNAQLSTTCTHGFRLDGVRIQVSLNLKLNPNLNSNRLSVKASSLLNPPFTLIGFRSHPNSSPNLIATNTAIQILTLTQTLQTRLGSRNDLAVDVPVAEAVPMSIAVANVVRVPVVPHPAVSEPQQRP